MDAADTGSRAGVDGAVAANSLPREGNSQAFLARHTVDQEDSFRSTQRCNIPLGIYSLTAPEILRDNPAPHNRIPAVLGERYSGRGAQQNKVELH